MQNFYDPTCFGSSNQPAQTDSVIVAKYKARAEDLTQRGCSLLSNFKEETRNLGQDTSALGRVSYWRRSERQFAQEVQTLDPANITLSITLAIFSEDSMKVINCPT